MVLGWFGWKNAKIPTDQSENLESWEILDAEGEGTMENGKTPSDLSENIKNDKTPDIKVERKKKKNEKVRSDGFHYIREWELPDVEVNGTMVPYGFARALKTIGRPFCGLDRSTYMSVRLILALLLAAISFMINSEWIIILSFLTQFSIMAAAMTFFNKITSLQDRINMYTEKWVILGLIFVQCAPIVVYSELHTLILDSFDSFYHFAIKMINMINRTTPTCLFILIQYLLNCPDLLFYLVCIELKEQYIRHIGKNRGTAVEKPEKPEKVEECNIADRPVLGQ